MSGRGHEVPTRAESVRAVRRVAEFLTSPGLVGVLVNGAHGDQGLAMPPRAVALLAFDPFSSVTVEEASTTHGDVSESSRSHRRGPGVTRNDSFAGSHAIADARRSARAHAPDSTMWTSSERSRAHGVTSVRSAALDERIPTRTDEQDSLASRRAIFARDEPASRRTRAVAASASPDSTAEGPAPSMNGSLKTTRGDPTHSGAADSSTDAPALTPVDPAAISGMTLLAKLTSHLHRASPHARASIASEGPRPSPPLGSRGTGASRHAAIASDAAADPSTQANDWRTRRESRLFPREALRTHNAGTDVSDESAAFDPQPSSHSTTYDARSNATNQHERSDVVDIIAAALRAEARRHGVDVS